MKSQKKIKNNRKMEEKILDKVYKFEEQRTVLTITRYAVLILGIGALILFILNQIVLVLSAQKTLDLLELFGEDQDIIKQYFSEVADTFIEETPKDLLLALLVFAIVFIFIVFLVAKNFGRIKNRVLSIIDHEKNR